MTMAGKPDLTPMQWAFVDAYKGTGNGREAAELAGFKHPRAAAHRLLKDPRVRKAIAQRRAKVEEKLVEHVVRNTVMKSDIIAGELRAIARLERLADAWEKSCEEEKEAKRPFKISLAEHARVCAALSAAWDKLAELVGHKISLSADVSKYFEDKSLEEREFFCIHGYFPDTLEPAEPGADGNTGMAAPGDPKGTLQ
jgi:phage terminase small subunit